LLNKIIDGSDLFRLQHLIRLGKKTGPGYIEDVTDQ